MGYRGQSYVVNLAEGGFSYDKNIDKIPPTAMTEPTKNINIHKGGRSKRGGTSPVNGTAITGTPRIWGLYQFILANGNTFILTATGDGKIQKDYTTEIATGLTIDRPVHFTTFNNLCIICTGNAKPYVWTGTGSATVLTNTPTDWTTNFPRKMVKHGKGASERLWAVYGKTKPHKIYASAQNTGDGTTEPDFSDINVLTFHIETEDGFGILNAVEYGDRLILSGKKYMYIFDDTSSDTALWGYNKAQWEGGTANDRTLISVTNDIISMDEDGTVYSVTAAQSYGDYKNASLTRTAPLGTPFIDEYIRSQTKIASISDYHMTYDPVLRAIYIFCVRTGQTVADTALCYFIDRGPENGWIIKDNINAASGYRASCSALVRKGAGNYKIYTGGWADGFVWELETATFHDNGSPYSSGFKTPRINLGDPRSEKRFDQTRLLIDTKGGYKLFIDIWVDGEFVGQQSVFLAGSSALYGTATYGSSTYGGSESVEAVFPVGRVGKRISYSIFNNNANEDFFVSQILIDFKPLSSFSASSLGG